MVTISYTRIREYIEQHADSKDALNNWFEFLKRVDWSDFNELKADYPSVDYVGNDRYVFNIRGNTYRLVALIYFSVRTVYIRFIGTHAEYDKLCKNNKIITI